MADFGWDQIGKKPATQQDDFDTRFPEYAKPMPTQEVVKKGASVVPDRPVSDYQEMPWTEVGKRAFEQAPQSAFKVLDDTARAVVHPIDTANALASTTKGLLHKGYRAVMGEPTVHGTDQLLGEKPDEAAADALIGDYKDKYGSMPGFKKRLAEDPFNIGMDAATVISPIGATTKATSTAGKLARASELALDPAEAAVAAAKKIVGKTSKGLGDLNEWGQQAYLAVHSGHPREAYKLMQEAGKMPGPEGVRARDTIHRFMSDNGKPDEIADAATKAFEEIKQKTSDNYKARFANSMKFTQPLSFQKVTDAAKEMADYANAGHPNAHDAALADEALQIIKDRFNDPKLSKDMDGFDRMKIDIRDRADGIQDARLKKKVFDMADAAKKTIVDSDPEYGKMMEEWQDWIKEANDLKKTIGAGNQKLSESTFIKKLQAAIKDDRKGELLNRLSETQSGRDLPYMIAGDNLKKMLPDWWFGSLAGVAPGAAAAFANPTVAAAMVPSAIAASPKLGANIAKATGIVRRKLGEMSEKAGKTVDTVNKPYVTNPLYQTQQDREGRKSGGRVKDEHEAIADKLVAQAEKAKKMLGKATEPLLGAPDEMVAKALEVANRNI